MLYFVGQVLPYIAGSIFLIGMVCRVAKWLKAPVPFQLTLFPAPKDGSARMMAIGQEMILFKSLYNNDKRLWLWAWLLHVSLALVIGGHVVGIYYLMNQFTLIGFTPSASQALSSTLGTVAGLILMISLIVLFYRRISEPEVKRLSDPADYFDLLLILAVVITGNHMRLPAVHVDLPAIKAYLGGILTFSPISIPENAIFISHFILVNLLLMYFPFSKLIHLAGFFVNRAMLTEAAPVYPTPAGTLARSNFANNTISSSVSANGQSTTSRGA